MLTSQKLSRDMCHGEVADMDHVTGKFLGFKPSRHVKMISKIPMTSRQPARFHRGNLHPQQDTGKSVTSRENQWGCHGFVGDLSRTLGGSRHGGIWA